jgi:hypothetical protein
MNGLIATTNFGSTWGEQAHIINFVCNMINSKIEFIELKTRKLLNNFRAEKNRGSHRSDSDSEFHIPSMSDIYVDKAENENLFSHLENLSRSIYLLEQLKLSITSENAYSIMELLNDDKYLTDNNIQVRNILKYSLAA